MYTICRYLLVLCFDFLFFFKQKTAYEMRISDWSSDVCSSDLKMARMTSVSYGNQIISKKSRCGCFNDCKLSWAHCLNIGINCCDAILKSSQDRKSVV